MFVVRRVTTENKAWVSGANDSDVGCQLRFINSDYRRIKPLTLIYIQVPINRNALLWLFVVSIDKSLVEHKEDSGDLLSPGQQTSCQKLKVTLAGEVLVGLCTNVPRCNS